MSTVVRHVPVSVAAALLGVSRQRIYELIRTGKLGYVRIGGTILVHMAAIEDRARRRSRRLEESVVAS